MATCYYAAKHPTAEAPSASRFVRWLELIECGMGAQKQEQFFELAERFRSATNPEDAKRLGDQLGRMLSGS